MSAKRKTVDCWRFYLNYGQGWEHEITEYTRGAMQENRKAYRENCTYPLRIKFGREKISELTPEHLAEIEADKKQEREERWARRRALTA